MVWQVFFYFESCIVLFHSLLLFMYSCLFAPSFLVFGCFFFLLEINPRSSIHNFQSLRKPFRVAEDTCHSVLTLNLDTPLANTVHTETTKLA